jgi:hypothetical protein
VIYESSTVSQDRKAACRARREIALDILPVAPRGLGSAVLGIALPLSRTGLNVRVFYDHVREASERQKTCRRTLFSHMQLPMRLVMCCSGPLSTIGAV